MYLYKIQRGSTVNIKRPVHNLGMLQCIHPLQNQVVYGGTFLKMEIYSESSESDHRLAKP
jgi:hypothetical protein